MRTPTCLLAALLLSAASAPASTFSVTNAGATFTITRSGDTSASETVRYRTVPLTAYPGQHYTAKSDTLVFAPGQTSTNIAVSEPSSTTSEAYRYQTGGRRSYRFDVTDEKGFPLASCDRSRQCGSIFSSGKLNSSVSSLVTLTSAGAFSSGMSSSKYVDVAYTPPSGDVQGSGKTLEGYVLIDDSYDYAQKPATVSTATLVDATGATGSYLASMGCKIHAAVCFAEKEKDDGYQYLQIVAGDSTASYDTGADPNGGVKDPTNSVYKVCFEFADGSNAEGNIYFPHRGTTSSEFSNSAGKLHQHKYKSGYGGSGAVVLPATTASITARFDAGGDNDDTWGYKDLFVRMALCDAVAPALYGGSSAGVVVAPGTYAVGSTVYVSVPFNEIVRVAGTPTLSTTWGTLSYVAGDGSNVLAFEGRIEAKPGDTLKINSLSGTVKDLAGNSLSVPLSINRTFSSCVAQIPWSGSGTEASPYLILTTGQLDALAIIVGLDEKYENKHFSLGADLAYPHATAWDDATSTENNYTPVGGYSKSFGGHFHGNGHVVSGIRIYRSGDTLDKGDSSLALFGYASGGSVRDVVVADANVSGYAYCGGVVGYNGATVTNCLAFNVRVAGRAASSAGAVAGYHDTNPSASRLLSNHYRDCTANGASLGIGTGSRGDLPGARSLHLLDLDPTVSASSDDTALVTNVLYYASAASVSLSYSGTPPVGHVLAGYETNSVPLLPDDLAAFAMPAADLSVAPRFRYAVYTIGYDLAGGALPAGASNPETYTMADATFTLANPVRTGYAFAGWTGTDLDGPTNEATVATGSLGDRDYLAHWTTNAYIVRFHANDGTAATRDQAFLYDEPQALDPAGARTGYDFSRWTVNADGSGASYLDGEVVSNLTAAADGVVDLHAQWTPHSYAVRFDANGGDGGSMPDQTGLVYGVATNLDANAFSRAGHDFAGWSATATGPVVYADRASVSNLTAEANGSVTLYAQWTIRVYDVVWLDWDGAPLLTNRLEYGSTPAYAGAAPTKAPDATNAWFFTGWTPAIAPVSGPASYLATFSPTSHWALLAEDLAAGGDIVLSRDVTATASDIALLVPAGVTATLDLAGHTIDRALAAPVVGGEAIRVAGSLALTNSAPASGAITGGNAVFSGGGVYVEIDGSFTMTGGEISGNSSDQYAGGVFVSWDGSFTMTGGAISGNSAKYYGGGVYVASDGSFTMNGGEISGNSTGDFGEGGGVYVYDGSFAMNGGEISANLADYGGGVRIGRDGTFWMNGGAISDNSADYFGGGVYVDGGSFTMDDGTISGNSADFGGGVYVDGGSFTMDDGTISGNSADFGGGVCIDGVSSFTMTGGEVSGNSAEYDGGGVYAGGAGSFAMTGGEISGNSAGKRGGGVYFDAESALFRVSGAPRVLGNVITNFADAAAPAVADDIHFRREESLLWVVDALAPEARLGIVPDARRAVTTNLCGRASVPNGALSNFFSDNPEFALALDADGEVCIVPPTYALAYVPQDHVAVSVWSIVNDPSAATNVAGLALAPASFEAAYSPDEPFVLRLDFDPGWFLDLEDENYIRLAVAGSDENVFGKNAAFALFDGATLYLVAEGPSAPATLSLALAPFSRTVTFQNVDGTVLQTGPVGYGVVPAYTNATPVLADPDERHYYAFSGWTPAPAPVVPNLAGGDPAGPVVYTAAYELRDKFAVVVDPNLAHGSVEVVLSSDLSFYSAPVPAGTKLWLLPSVESGYGVVSLSVAGTNGIPVEADADGTFTMPAFDVIVSATFDEALPISLRKDETAQDAIDGWSVTAGGVWMDPPAAAPGAVVELDFYMASFLFAPNVAVATTNGAEVAFTVSCADEAAGSWTVRFTMPAEPVVVTISVVPATFDSLVLLPATNTVDAASRVFSFVPQETGVYRIAMDGGDLSVYDSLARGLLYGTGEASYVLLAGETYYVTARAGYFWNWDGASRPLVAEKLPDPVVLYSVSADPSIAHGTVRPSVTNAPEGYPVYPTPDPAPGYAYVEGSLRYIVGDATNELSTAYDGTPVFWIPAADVVLTADFEPIPFAVTVDPSLVHGTVEVYVVTSGGGAGILDKTEPYSGPVPVGTLIDLRFSPDPGYGLASWSVVDASGVPVAVDERGFFAMPPSDVTVSATFAEALPISVRVDESAPDAISYWSVHANGVYMDPAAAAPGAAVEMFVDPASFLFAPTAAVTTASGAAVACEVLLYDESYGGRVVSFTMPAEPVVVSLSVAPATFDSLVLLPATNTVNAESRVFSFVPEETGVYRFAMDDGFLGVVDCRGEYFFAGEDEASGALLAGETYYVHVHAGDWDGTPRPLVAERTGGTFTPYAVAVDPDIAHGTVSTSHDSAPEYHPVYATPVPAPGYAYVEGSLRYIVGGETNVLYNAYDGTPFFQMPAADVLVTAEFEPIPFAVTVDPDIEHGTVEVNAWVLNEEHHFYFWREYSGPVPAGTQIQLSASPDPGYGFVHFSVADTNGVSVAVDEWGYFTMPASDVTVSATFAEALPISVEIAEAAQDAICDWSVSANGIGMDPAAAAPGAAVVLEVFTTLIRYAPTVVVATTNGAAVSAAIECPDETYPCWLAHFTMPAEPVAVSLSAVPATFDLLVLLPSTNTVDTVGRVFSFVPEETGVYRFAMDDSSLAVFDRHNKELFEGYDEMSGTLLAGETYYVYAAAGDWDGTPRPLVAEKLPDQVVLHSVAADPAIVGGTVRPSVAAAPEGYYVYVVPDPAPGYACVEYSLRYVYGGETNRLWSAYDGTPYFRMPAADVVVTAEFEPIPFAVVVDPAVAHGTVDVDVVIDGSGGDLTTTSYDGPVLAGTKIQLEACPDPGYGLVSWSVADTNGGSVAVDEWNVFTMPASDVTVSATFAKALPIVVESDAATSNRVWYLSLSANGVWIGDPEDFAAVPGATAELLISSSFVFAPTATIVTASGAPVEPPHEFLYEGEGEWIGSFTMPDEPVVVTLSLVPADYPPLHAGTNEVDVPRGYFMFTPETTGFYSFAAGEGDSIGVYDSFGDYLGDYFDDADDNFCLVAGERYYVEYYADGDEGHDIVVTKTSDAYAVLVDPAVAHGSVWVYEINGDNWAPYTGPVLPGTGVGVDFEPDPGYGLVSWSVVDTNGVPVEVGEWGEFAMPASDVTVSTVVARTKSISVEEDEAAKMRINYWQCYAGGVFADPTAAAPGAEVMLWIEMMSRVFAPTASVATAGGAEVETSVEYVQGEDHSGWSVRFTMPAEPVVVSLSAGPADYPPLHEGTNDVGAVEVYRARYFTFAPEMTGCYEFSSDADDYVLDVRDSFGSWMDGLPLLAGETYFICYVIPESRETNTIVVTRTDDAVATYAVAVDPSIAGGTVTPSVLLAAEGSRVYLTAAEDADTVLGTLRATWTNGTETVELGISEGAYGATYFTMPAGDVTVTAGFINARTLTVVANAKASLYFIAANGTYYDKSPVKVGTNTEVVVNFLCPLGYELRASVATAAGAPVPRELGENGYSLAFTMPDAPVVVTVSSVRSDLPALVVGDNAVDAEYKLFSFTPSETGEYCFSSADSYLHVYDDQGDYIRGNGNSLSIALVGGETYFVEYEYQGFWDGTAKNLLVEKLGTAVELYRIAVDPGIEGGTIETSVTNAPYGHRVYLRPVPAPGYAYVEGSIVVRCGSDVDRPYDNGDGTFSFSMPDADVVVTALFDPVPFAFPPYLDGADDTVLTNYVNWASVHGPDTAGTQEAAFLLNVAPSATPTELRIDGIEVGAEGATIRASATAGGAAVDLTKINGILAVEAGDTVTNLVPKAVQGATFSADGTTATIPVPSSDGFFLRARIGTSAP